MRQGGCCIIFCLIPALKRYRSPDNHYSRINRIAVFLPANSLNIILKSLITIRVATSQDNMLLAQLGSETFEKAFGAANTPEDMAAFLAGAFSPELQATELADPLNIFWLVFVGEALTGYVKMFTGPAAACVTSSKALKISRLYLLQPWWGN